MDATSGGPSSDLMARARRSRSGGFAFAAGFSASAGASTPGAKIRKFATQASPSCRDSTFRLASMVTYLLRASGASSRSTTAHRGAKGAASIDATVSGLWVAWGCINVRAALLRQLAAVRH